jgi:hypothetical protein
MTLACQVATIRAMSKAYKKSFGRWPSNYKA